MKKWKLSYLFHREIQLYFHSLTPIFSAFFTLLIFSYTNCLLVHVGFDRVYTHFLHFYVNEHYDSTVIKLSYTSVSESLWFPVVSFVLLIQVILYNMFLTPVYFPLRIRQVCSVFVWMISVSMAVSSICSYSWDEGETWNSYTFHDETIRVYGVLTEPGEATAIFSIFGSHLGYHKWLIIQVNMEKVFRE